METQLIVEASIGQLDNNWLVLLIPALPILAAIIGYTFKRIGITAAVISGIGANLLALGVAAVLFSQEQAGIILSWISLPDNQVLIGTQFSQIGLDIPLAFIVNPKSLLFIITTAAISIAVLIYAHREREGDPRGTVLISTLNLFTGAMLLFLTADTLLLIYFAWELMGVCSYLLIAHNGTTEAKRAARQAFWTTRATDFALLFAIIIAMGRFGLSQLSQINIMGIITRLEEYATSVRLDPGSPEFEVLRNTEFGWISAILILVLVAVIGKSALLPLSHWLPDAMVAPSPVSALLHAATMVAAGPYLLIQLGDLFIYSQPAMVAATLTGALSLLLGGVMALCSTDPKRILAYSTVSHMGLVVLGVGALASGPAYLHLLAHAWFKAALFIAIGLIVAQHARSAGATKMDAGSLKSLAGVVRGNFLLTIILVISGLSLAGFFGFGGYFGKEHIFSSLLFQMSVKVNETTTLADKYPLAAAAWRISWGMMLISFALTAAYITRLVGVLLARRDPDSSEVQESIAMSGTKENTPRISTGKSVIGSLFVVALVGSVGLGAGWQITKGIITPGGETLMWDGPLKYPNMWAIGLAFTIVGCVITYVIRVAKPVLGDSISRDDGALLWLKDFFGNGMYLREFWATSVGKTGEFLAILSAITDVGVIDTLAVGSGKTGRCLASGSSWLDKHFIDGMRYRVCQICWKIKEIHGRFCQTGRIQRYMFVIVLSAAVLCLIIIKPLGERMISGLENLIQEGII